VAHVPARYGDPFTHRRKRRNRKRRSRQIVGRQFKQAAQGVVARSLRMARAHLRLGLVVAGFSLLIVGAHYWATHSPRFAVKHIEVIGAKHASTQELIQMSGLHSGENVFTVDTASARQAVLENPWISETRVERGLPNRLRIVVKEHVPTAIAVLGPLYLVNAEGRPFKVADVSRGENRGLPVITGIDREEYQEDQPAAERRLKDAIAVADAYRSDPSRPPLGEVRSDLDRGFELFTYEPAVSIVLGRGSIERVTAQLKAFDATWRALSSAERSQAKTIYIDRDPRPSRVMVSFAQTNASHHEPL
jgi:cell division protein FtsQ